MQMFCVLSRGTPSSFLDLSLRHDIPFVIDALSYFIFISNLQKAAVFYSAMKDAIFGNILGKAYG